MTTYFTVTVSVTAEVCPEEPSVGALELIPLDEVSGWTLLSLVSQPVEAASASTSMAKSAPQDAWMCMLLGVPARVRYHELEAFLGPYCHDISRILIVRSPHDCHTSLLSAYLSGADGRDCGCANGHVIDDDYDDNNNDDDGDGDLGQHVSACVMLFFHDKTARTGFMSIYHGLHFPPPFRPRCSKEGEGEGSDGAGAGGESSALGSSPCIAIPVESLVTVAAAIPAATAAADTGTKIETETEGVGKRTEKVEDEGEEEKEEGGAFLVRRCMGSGEGGHGEGMYCDEDTAPATQLLPTCALCFSRVDARISGIPLAADVGLMTLAAKALPCFVCRLNRDVNINVDQAAGTGSGSESGISTSIGGPQSMSWTHCVTCGIRENLWVCLVCGHLGCGRYTAEHARLHFHTFGHSFALELATGRVWDYDRDTFVHNAELQEAMAEHALVDGGGDPYLSSLWGGGCGSGGDCGSSNLGLARGVEGEERKRVGGGAGSLEQHTQEKLNDILSDHQFILACQLEQQKLHYERLLARATREALERKQEMLGQEQEQEETSVVASGSSSSTSTGTSIGSVPSASNSANCVPRIDGDESEEYWRLKYAYATTSPEDVTHVEALKTDISLLEEEYLTLTSSTVEAEREHTAVKRRNTKLMQQQKALMDTTKALDARVEELVRATESEGAGLREQIRDIEFYVSAQRRVGGQGGSLIVTEAPQRSVRGAGSKKNKKKGIHRGG